MSKNTPKGDKNDKIIKPLFINCHTYFSFHYGIFSPEKLVETAAIYGIDTLVLTDINNTAAVFDFFKACRDHGIKAVPGIEYRKDDQLLFIGIARNHEGFYELNNMLSCNSLYGDPLTTFPSTNVYFVFPYYAGKNIEALHHNEFIGIRPQDINKLYNSSYKEHPEKLLVWQPVTFPADHGFYLHRLLRAIDQNSLLSTLDNTNGACRRETFMPHENLEAFFQDYPSIIHNTCNLLASCEFDPDTVSVKNKTHFTGSHQEDFALLKKLAYEGFQYRYDADDYYALERMQTELQVIYNLGFAAYFLITWDIIRYAASRGFHHVGRGSGANSIVAYCMRITDVDPVELNLYFERFINPERSSPPDFDIDFSWDERDELVDYVFKRYGKEYVALLATYSTFQYRSVAREVGKVYGLSKPDIDVLAGEPGAKHKHHPLAAEIRYYAAQLAGFPNHLSIHAGGILISQKPINYYCACKLMPKGFPVTHFDMHVAEDIGFHKFDILSQRGIGHIKEAVRLIRENRGQQIDIHDIKTIKQDEKVKALLRKAKTTGCFYIESPAMRGLLSKLCCDDYFTLVAASSIIRPGVAQSGMMREYIARHRDHSKIHYLHPVFRDLLQETYGVMVYQEDVIRIAHHFAGLELSEADILRRGMSGKSRSKDEFQRIRDKFFSNCRKKGYQEHLIKEVWRQIESFAGYSFCKAHSASYAVESFQSLYLKAYYPLEFITAVLNNFGGFYTTEIYVHEARMEGAAIEAPCLNNSRYLNSIKNNTLYLGFVMLKGLENKIADVIVKEREENGLYLGLEDFMQRVPIKKEQLSILIRAGAFRFTGKNKHALLWEKNYYLQPVNINVGTGYLFEPSSGYSADVLPFDSEEEEEEKVFEQMDILGFPLYPPFGLLKTNFRGDIDAQQMKQYSGEIVRMVGYFVCRKIVPTVNKKIMSFATWIDAKGLFFDTVHFPPSLKNSPFRGRGCYLIKGKIMLEFGFATLEVTRMEKLPLKILHDLEN